MSFSRPEVNFTIISNTIILDERLSWKAKGIYLYAMSRPANWTFYLCDIVNHSTDGRDAVNSGLKELETFGYLIRTKRRDEAQKFAHDHWEFIINPDEFKKSLPQTGFPLTAKPSAGNPPLIKTDINKTDKEKDLSKDKSKKSTPSTMSEPSARLASFLLEKIKEHSPNFKQPNLESWAQEIDRMIRLDKRSEDEIKKVIAWSTTDTFWYKNILSATKLRQKFDTLYLQMKDSKLKSSLSSSKKTKDINEMMHRTPEDAKPYEPMTLEKMLANVELFYPKHRWEEEKKIATMLWKEKNK